MLGIITGGVLGGRCRNCSTKTGEFNAIENLWQEVRVIHILRYVVIPFPVFVNVGVAGVVVVIVLHWYLPCYDFLYNGR